MFGFYGNNVNINIFNGGLMPPPMPAYNNWFGMQFFGGMLGAALCGRTEYSLPSCGCSDNMFTGLRGFDLINPSWNFGCQNSCESFGLGNSIYDYSSSPFYNNNYSFANLANIFDYTNQPACSICTTPRLTSKTKNNSKLISRVGSTVGETSALTAKKYIGYKESDNSYKLFTNGRTEAWCADFVTYVVKESYKNMGKKVPDGFGSKGVLGLKNWGIKNNCFVDFNCDCNKKELIKNNVKVGDIAIYGDSKCSTTHTGIITAIDWENQTITAINGNSKDGDVATRTYKMSDPYVKGVVMLPA